MILMDARFGQLNVAKVVRTLGGHVNSTSLTGGRHRDEPAEEERRRWWGTSLTRGGAAGQAPPLGGKCGATSVGERSGRGLAMGTCCSWPRHTGGGGAGLEAEGAATRWPPPPRSRLLLAHLLELKCVVGHQICNMEKTNLVSRLLLITVEIRNLEYVDKICDI